MNATRQMIAGERAHPVPAQTIVTLCDKLRRASIRYCHWKSNNALDKSASGENDLDLLVAREDAPRFTAVLSECGFKLAHTPADKKMPGVLDYFTYDFGAEKWIHVHAHFQLVAGHDLSKNYRLAVEQPYLDSSTEQGIFKVPRAEFEFVVFVVRMVLKHATWDAILCREGRLKRSEREERRHLQASIDRDEVERILRHHMPNFEPRLFRECVAAIAPESTILTRIKAAYQLEKRMRGNARRARAHEIAVKVIHRFVSMARWRLVGSPQKYRLTCGGAIIALVGGDGSGKSTAVAGLHRWLSTHFDCRCVHLGKPTRSLVTLALRSILKIGQMLGLYGLETSMRETLNERSLVSPGYPWLIREVCRARDRYRLYLKAKRRVSDGRVVICDRFPHAQIEMMDGPLARRFVRELDTSPGSSQYLRPRLNHRLATYLIDCEESYYNAFLPPEFLAVLRLHPQIAVARKPDDHADEVRERSAGIWAVDWSSTEAHVIDAAKSKEEVLAELKRRVLARL